MKSTIEIKSTVKGITLDVQINDEKGEPVFCGICLITDYETLQIAKDNFLPEIKEQEGEFVAGRVGERLQEHFDSFMNHNSARIRKEAVKQMVESSNASPEQVAKMIKDSCDTHYARDEGAKAESWVRSIFTDPDVEEAEAAREKQMEELRSKVNELFTDKGYVSAYNHVYFGGFILRRYRDRNTVTVEKNCCDLEPAFDFGPMDPTVNYPGSNLYFQTQKFSEETGVPEPYLMTVIDLVIEKARALAAKAEEAKVAEYAKAVLGDPFPATPEDLGDRASGFVEHAAINDAHEELKGLVRSGYKSQGESKAGMTYQALNKAMDEIMEYGTEGQYLDPEDYSGLLKSIEGKKAEALATLSRLKESTIKRHDESIRQVKTKLFMDAFDRLFGMFEEAVGGCEIRVPGDDGFVLERDADGSRWITSKQLTGRTNVRDLLKLQHVLNRLIPV